MIHKYQFREKYILLDVNSGAVHIVSKIIYDILDYYPDSSAAQTIEILKDKYSEKDLLNAFDEIICLENEGLLFSDDSHVTDEIIHGKKPAVKALCLHVAHDCNMQCVYCFGTQGSFKGNRCLMSFETGRKAIDFLMENSGSRRNLEIDFFGGEPLMNFDVVKKLVEYGRKTERNFGKNIRFTLTTNGLLLDSEKAEYINNMMDNVILSIDGRPEVNDEMRKTLNNQGTYDLIINNYLKFAENRKALYYVRGTFTRKNLDFSNDILHLINCGFKNVSVEPVVADDACDFSLREEDLNAILEEYDKLADLYIEKARMGKRFEFFHFNIDLNQGPCIIKRISGCGAGTEYLAVSPEGDIYPCHQFVGMEDFKIGNLYEKHYENKLYDMFNSAHIYNKEQCKKCWAKFYCSGGCHANAYHISGNILKPYELGCIMEKKRVECAIGIQAIFCENE